MKEKDYLAIEILFYFIFLVCDNIRKSESEQIRVSFHSNNYIHHNKMLCKALKKY